MRAIKSLNDAELRIVLCPRYSQYFTTQFTGSWRILQPYKTPINITIKWANRDFSRLRQQDWLYSLKSVRWKSNTTALIVKCLDVGQTMQYAETITICHIGRTSDTSKNLVIYQVSGCNIHCLSLVIRYCATVTHSYSDLLQGVAFHLCRFKHYDTSLHTKHVDKLCFKRSSLLNVALQTLFGRWHFQTEVSERETLRRYNKVSSSTFRK